MDNEELEDLQDALNGQLALLKRHLAVQTRTEPRFRTGQVVLVNLPLAKIVTATIKKVLRQTDGVRFLIEYEGNQAALIQSWQVLYRRLPRTE
jgi:hypothetical protein